MVTNVRELATARPFLSSAKAYLAKGWKPMPLPERAKSEPLEGFTGWENPSSKIDKTQVQRWIDNKKWAKGNIAIRPTEDMYALDVDAYKAAESLAKMAEDIGHPLNATWVNTARSDGSSGHYVFRVPPGLRWPSKPAPGIESVHFGHRYLVVGPSVHPDIDDEDSGAEYYRWYAPGAELDGSGSFEPPNWSAIPEMDPAWVEYISTGQGARHFPEKKLPGRSLTAKAAVAQEWVDSHDGEPCGIMLKAVKKLEADVQDPGIHDTARDALFHVLQLAGEGHRGLAEIVPLIEDAFIGERTSEAGSTRHTSKDDPYSAWRRILVGGVGKTMYREEQGEFLNMSCMCPSLRADGEPMAEINVRSYKLSSVLGPCYESLGEGIYLSSGNISLYQDSKLHPLNKDSLRVELDRVVHCYTPRKLNDVVYKDPAAPPDNLVLGLLHSPDRWRALPRLDRIARTPYYARVDGAVRLVSENGYHADQGTLVEIDLAMLDAMAKVRVTDRNLERALELLLEDLLGDFPFVEESDKATILAALLLPFVRELIDGPTPLHFIDAPSPRSGKSLLASVISLVTVGPGREGYALMAAPADSREWGKKLLATMLSLPNMLVIDNVSNQLASPDLAAALTAYPYLQERILGKSEMGSPVNKALWVATGNNVRASDEIARRIVPCRIDSREESPHARTGFRHLDLLGWTARERHALVWALCVLVENWVGVGAPVGKATLGGFESWARVVGGILDAAGVDGLLDNQARFLADAEDETEEITEFVRAWVDWAGVGKENHKTGGEFEAMIGLLDIIEIGRSTVARAVGNYLRKYKDRAFLGYRIEFHTVKGTRYWYLNSVGEAKDAVRKARSKFKPRG